MAMYGWIASTPDFGKKISNPQTLGLLQKFSYSEGRAPFKFELGDVVDTHNSEGSYDHTVWIEIYDKESGEELGELSTDISDKTVGVSGSKHIMLATCLERLGFVDEDIMNDFGDDALPDEAASLQHSARIKAAARLLKAISTGIELGESYKKPSGTPSQGTADDIKAQRRDEDYKRTAPEREQVRVLREAEAKAKVFYRGLLTTKLSDGTKVSDYLDQEGGSWSSLFGNTRFSQVSRLVSKKLQEFLSSGVQVGRVQVALTEEEKEVFSEAKIGPNWRDSVEKILEDEQKHTGSTKLAQCISALDTFIKTGNCLPENKD